MDIIVSRSNLKSPSVFRCNIFTYNAHSNVIRIDESRMGSHDRIYDNSRSYIVVVVVAHKSPQLEFSNLENFSMEISDAFGATSPTRYGRNFSFTKMNKFLALFSKRTCAHPAVSDVPHHFHKIFQRIGESTGKLSRVLLSSSTRIFLLFVLGRIKKSRLPSRTNARRERRV